MSQFKLLLVIFAACWSLGVFAQTEEEELAQVYGDKELISIATGSLQSLRRAPSVATVITAEDISAMGATDLDQVLETVPGLHVSRSPNHYSPLYVIRGIFTQYLPQTLVMQDGIPVTTLFQGNKGNLWGGYPVEHIARIEIIRGPGSALYGADAYSGVINIITKQRSDISGTNIGVRNGSFNTRDAWVQQGATLDGINVAAYVRVGRSDGFKRTVDADGQTRLDQIFGTHSSVAPGPVNTGYDATDANFDFGYDRWRFRAGYKLRENMGTGAGIASALDAVGKGRSERITSDISWIDRNAAKDWGLGFDLGYLKYIQQVPVDYQLYPPGATFATGTFPDGMYGGPDTYEQQLRFSAFVTYAGIGGHNLRVGLGHDDLDLYRTHETRNFTYAANGTPVPAGPVVDYSSTNPFLFPQKRKIDYLYMQDEWALARDWTLTAGLRRDRYSDFGNTTNPRLALVWDATYALTAKLLYGRAFRAPSFNELYGFNNPVVRGNANLLPETINTVEAVFSWTADQHTQLQLNFFRYDMADIIRTLPNAVAGTGATYANTGRQHGSGVELESEWDDGRGLKLVGNYSFQKSIDESTGQDAGYAPHHLAYARADWRFAEDWLLAPQCNWVAGRKRAFGDTRPDIADYTTVDLTLRTGLDSGQWEVAASVRNLFNADVREPSLAPGTSIPNDLPMAPRSLYVQAQLKL